MTPKSATKKLCHYAFKVAATKDCAKGYSCKLDANKVVYPDSCEHSSHGSCWRLKFK
jgi:hypothetical protein